MREPTIGESAATLPSSVKSKVVAALADGRRAADEAVAALRKLDSLIPAAVARPKV